MARVASSVVLACILLIALLAIPNLQQDVSRTANAGAQPEVQITPTPYPCPMPTPEPLWVEPVISPTESLTQTLTVRIGNGEAVTVTAPSGVFAVTGTFNAYTQPALVELDLLPDTTHQLTVQARVREQYQNGCRFGGYTLSTQQDRHGAPLTIVQQGNSTPWLPLYFPFLGR